MISRSPRTDGQRARKIEYGGKGGERAQAETIRGATSTGARSWGLERQQKKHQQYREHEDRDHAARSRQAASFLRSSVSIAVDLLPIVEARRRGAACDGLTRASPINHLIRRAVLLRL